jgi:hypothetical protein
MSENLGLSLMLYVHKAISYNLLNLFDFISYLNRGQLICVWYELW